MITCTVLDIITTYTLYTLSLPHIVAYIHLPFPPVLSLTSLKREAKRVMTYFYGVLTSNNISTHPSTYLLVQYADIVGRAFAIGRVLTEHENVLDHAHTQLQHT